MERHDGAVERQAVRQLHVIAHARLPAGHLPRGIHSPTQQRLLGDPIGGETPYDKAVMGGCPKPWRGVAQREHRLACRRAERQRHGQRGEPAGDQCRGQARTPPSQREGEGCRDEPEDGAQAHQPIHGDERRQEDQQGEHRAAALGQIEDRDPAGEGEHGRPAIEDAQLDGIPHDARNRPANCKVAEELDGKDQHAEHEPGDAGPSDPGASGPVKRQAGRDGDQATGG